MIEIGTVLQGRFLIEEQIGVGGMGAVYRAVDQKFGTVVAIKETFYRDKELAEAFEREARLLNGLHHPLFPHVSDHFTEGEGHFLVMEYIEGEDLSQILKRGERPPFETVLRWTLDLIDGIDYLHSQDPPIIHRDIKPSNLKLTSRGNLVLLDFGMAKETSGNTQGMRSVFGYSRRYSPLEQIEGAGTDERSDLFSLGATVFHLLTGAPPVDVLRRASAIVAGRPDPIQFASELNPNVPVRVAKIIETALELDPGRRFASARAMWNALESAAGVPNPVSSHVGFSEDLAPPDSRPGSPPEEFESAEAASSNAPVFRAVNEDENDPVAALVALRVAEMKAREMNTIPDGPDVTARIEVPIISEPEIIPDDVQEFGTVDTLEANEIPATMPAEFSKSVSPRYRTVGLLSIPLLILVLGIAGYMMMGSRTEGETTTSAPEQPAAANGPSRSEAPAPSGTEEQVVSESSTAPDEEPSPTPAEDRADLGAKTARSGEPPRSDQAAVERTRSDSSEATKRSDSPTVRRQDQARNRDRNDRIARPRIVDEEVFEQPPVSSIESIMTGIPSDRPRRQRRWEVMEEDQLRRERRIRRINRRNRQRLDPLY